MSKSTFNRAICLQHHDYRDSGCAMWCYENSLHVHAVFHCLDPKHPSPTPMNMEHGKFTARVGQHLAIFNIGPRSQL